MTDQHLRNVIEAALLAAGKPLTVAELVQLFDEDARPANAVAKEACGPSVRSVTRVPCSRRSR